MFAELGAKFETSAAGDANVAGLLIFLAFCDMTRVAIESYYLF